MAVEKELSYDGTKITYRRLLWGERKKIKQSGLLKKGQNPEDVADEDVLDELVETVLKMVVSPPEAVDKIDVKEAYEIYLYALGADIGDQEKN